MILAEKFGGKVGVWFLDNAATQNMIQKITSSLLKNNQKNS
jgi:hypothetical protein